MKYKLILKRNIKHNYSEALDIDALKKLQKYRGGSHVVSNFIRDYRHDNNTKFFDLIDIVDRITKSKLRSVSGKDRKILRDLVLKKGVDDSKKHCSDIIYDDVMSKVASSYTLSGRFDDEPLSRFNPVTGNKKKAFSTAIKTGSEDALMGGYHNTSSKNRLKKFIRSKIEKAVDNFFKKSHLDESTNYSEAFDKDGFDWVKEKSNTSGRWAAKYLSRKKHASNNEFLKFKKDLKEKRQHMSRNEFKNYLDNLMFDLTTKKADYGDVDFRGIGGLRRHFDTDSISKDTKAFRRFVKSVKAYGDSLLNPDLGLVSTFQKKLGKELKHNKDKIDQLQFNTTESTLYAEKFDPVKYKQAKHDAGGSHALARKLRDEKHGRNLFYLGYVDNLKRMKKNGVSIPKQDVDDLMAYTYSTQGDDNISSLKKLFDTNSEKKKLKSLERRRRRIKRDADSIRLLPDFKLSNSADELDAKLLNNEKVYDESTLVNESNNARRFKQKPKRKQANSDRFDYKMPKIASSSIKDQNPTSSDIVSTPNSNELSNLITKTIVSGITGDPIKLKKSISFFNSLKNEVTKVLTTNKNSKKYPMLKNIIKASNGSDPETVFKSLVQKPMEFISDSLSANTGNVAKGKAGKDMRTIVKIGNQLEQSSGQSKSTLLANLNKILQSL